MIWEQTKQREEFCVQKRHTAMPATRIRFDQARPSENRKKLIRWLAANFPKLHMLFAAWLHKQAARR